MNLIYLLPDDYRKSVAVVELQSAIEQAGTAAELAVEDVMAQLFLDTATWGLTYWEKMYGIEGDVKKSYEIRRSVVRAKMRGVGTTTVEMMKNVAESFVNGEVEVIEENHLYQFQIKMLSVIGIPPNMEDLKQAIEEIKPAHLGYGIVIKYNTWGMVKDKPMTWGDAKKRTWQALKEVAL